MMTHAQFNPAMVNKADMDAIRLFTKGYRSHAEKTLSNSLKSKLPNYTGAMYRGMHNFNILAERAKEYEFGGFDCTIGDVFVLDAIASWSKLEAIAKEFAEGKDNSDADVADTNTIFFIEKGFGYDLQEHSAIPEEQEVITLPNTKFRVLSIEDTGCEEYRVGLEIVCEGLDN